MQVRKFEFLKHIEESSPKLITSYISIPFIVTRVTVIFINMMDNSLHWDVLKFNKGLMLNHFKILYSSNLFPFNNLWSTNFCTLFSPCLFCLLNFIFCCLRVCTHMSTHGWRCVCMFVSFIPDKPSCLFSKTAVNWVAFFFKYYFIKDNQRGWEVLIIHLLQKTRQVKLFSETNMSSCILMIYQ